RSADISRSQALELLDTGWTLEEVGEIFNVSEKSIWRWEDKLTQQIEVSPMSVLRGCPRLLNMAIMAELQASSRNPHRCSLMMGF
ncbi:hypothetical protein PAXRUDRAFT_662785, partial [Paxillus rubicundulus Ve08.2h10]